jgi:hypothetical protein
LYPRMEKMIFDFFLTFCLAVNKQKNKIRKHFLSVLKCKYFSRKLCLDNHFLVFWTNLCFFIWNGFNFLKSSSFFVSFEKIEGNLLKIAGGKSQWEMSCWFRFFLALFALLFRAKFAASFSLFSLLISNWDEMHEK